MKNKDNKKKSILETIFTFPPTEGIVFGCMLTGLFDEIKLCKKYGIVKAFLEDYEDVFFYLHRYVYFFNFITINYTYNFYI